MKLSNLLTLILLVFIGVSASGQSIKDFKKEIKGITKATKMTDAQTDKVTAVYAKIVEDLKNIESLRSDEQLYRQKRRAIYYASQFSLEQIVTAEQKSDYIDYKRKLRAERGTQIKKLNKQKASKDDILDAELGIK